MKRFILLFILIVNYSFALMTKQQETTIINTTPFHIEHNVNSAQYKLNPAIYGSEITKKFEDTLYKKLIQPSITNNLEKFPLEITIIFADESEIKYNGITREMAQKENQSIENSNDVTKAAKGMVQGTADGFKTFASSFNTGNGNPIELLFAATFSIFGGIIGLFGQDNSYIAVLDIKYNNQKTRLFLQTTKMHLSADDAIETLADITIQNINILFKADN